MSDASTPLLQKRRLLIAGALTLGWGTAFTEPRRLRVALPDVPPFSAHSASGAPRGLLVDWMLSLAGVCKITMRIEVVPFARANHLLSLGAVDLIVATPSGDNAVNSQVLGEIAPLDLVVWPLDGVDRTLATQWHGVAVGRLRGGCLALEIQSPQFVELTALSHGLRMAALGRLQGLCASREALTHLLKQQGQSEALRHTPMLLQRTPLQVLVRKLLPSELMQALQQGVAQLQNEQRYAKLHRQWGLD